MKKRLYQWLASVLSILMLAQLLPMGVFAAEVKKAAAEKEIVPAVESAAAGEVNAPVSDTAREKEAVILYEEVEKREEYVKHFRMSDGTVQAAVYGIPVHYFENGAWENVDLTVDDSASDELNYGKNSFESKFSKKSGGKKLVTLTKGSYGVSWYLENAEKVSADYRAPGEQTPSEDPSALKNLVGAVTYPEIMEQVDLEYRISGSGVKENIILKEDSAPSQFRFAYETKHLSWRMTDAGEIVLFDPAREDEAVFTIEKPYLYDSARIGCDKVEMRIEDEKNGKFTLVITPDEEWLSSKERVWPVVIDPATLSSQNAADIWDNDMQNNQTAAHNYRATDLLVGTGSGGVKCRSLVRVPTLPAIGVSNVVNAQLYLRPYPGKIFPNDSELLARPAGPIQVNAHRMTGQWPEEGATWNEWSGQYDPIVEDYFLYNNTSDSFFLDLTEAVSQWYQGTSPNYGIILKSADESTSEKLMQFASSDWGQDGTNSANARPYFVVHYRSKVGMEDYWSYTSQPSSFGTGYINNHSGNLVTVVPVAAYRSGVNGFTLSLTYNSAKAGENIGYGNGWRLNFHQTLLPKTDSNYDKLKFVYTDGDGTEHYLIQMEDGSIVDEDGLGYTYSHHTDGNPHRLTTKDQSVLHFDSENKLVKISDANGNYINIYYTNSGTHTVIERITATTAEMQAEDTTERVIFTYENDVLLKSVVPTDADQTRTTEYTHQNQNLTQITPPEASGGAIDFGYVAESRLADVYYPDGMGYHYTFDSLGRVASVNQFGIGKDENGNDRTDTRLNLTFSYTYNQTKITDPLNRTTTYQFDTFGRPTCIYDGSGNAYHQGYTEGGDTKNTVFTNNKVALQASTLQYIDNMIKNPCFGSGFSDWGQYEQNASAEFNVETVEGPLAPTAVKITNTEAVDAAVNQFPSCEVGVTYTFSAYVKTNNVSGGKGAGATVGITLPGGGQRWVYSEYITGTTNTNQDNGFRRVELTFTLAQGETIHCVGVGLDKSKGTAWFQGIQLEKGDSANHVNLLSNSGFETNSTAYYAATAGSVITRADGTYAYKIDGDAFSERTIYQVVANSGKAGDAYSFGAWAKANAVASQKAGNTAAFQMKLEFIPASGEAQTETINFNENVSDWQCAEKTVIAEKDFSSIRITLVYSYQCNTAYFDSLFLYRDTAQSYRYDKNGNVASTSDYASQNSNFSYDGADLSKLTAPEGSGFEYFYDLKGNLLSSRSSEGVTGAFIYDANGNPTSSLTYGGESSAALQEGKTYYIQLKSNGNYLTFAPDGYAKQASFITSGEVNGYDTSRNQKWKLVANGGGYVLESLADSSKALTVQNASTVNDAKLVLAPKDGSDSQRFFLRPQSSHTYQLEVACGDNGRVLTMNETWQEITDVTTVTPPWGKAHTAQSWIIKEVLQVDENADLAEGYYRIRARHSGAYLDLQGYNASAGTPMIQYEDNDSGAQIFYLKESNDQNYYTISPAADTSKRFYVDQVAAGERLCLAPDGQTLSDSMLFYFVYSEARGGYQIFSKLGNNLCLDVDGANCENGRNVFLYGSHNGLNQAFILEPLSSLITSSVTYQAGGNFPATSTDSRGNTTRYAYDTYKGLQTSVTDPKKNVTEYTYDANTDLVTTVTAFETKTVNGVETKTQKAQVQYTYDKGHLSSISSPSGVNYTFEYDPFRQNTAIKVGGNLLSRNTYDAMGKITQTTYGADDPNTADVDERLLIVDFAYDNLDRLTEKKYNDTTKVRYHYNKMGQLTRVEDLFVNVTTNYRYDLIGRVLEETRSDGTSVHYEYDEFNRVKKVSGSAGTSFETEYVYGDGTNGTKTGLLYGVKHSGSTFVSYAYDSLYRLSTRTIPGAGNFTTTYTYLPGANAHQTTTLVSSIQNGNETLSYTYDANGNITSVSKGDTLVESYEYDALNQLKKVTKGTDVWTYTYDAGGNLLFVHKNGAANKFYSYGNTNWKDQLTEFNLEEITYDAIGNPLQYRNGLNFTWQNGRQLATVTKGTDSISYTYNADGIRIGKTVNGATTSFEWANGDLKAQTGDVTNLFFFYDENGTPISVMHYSTRPFFITHYYYVYNLQGDVIALIDTSGTKVVEYEYNPWGELLSVKDANGDPITDATHVGNCNPFRYRGYYYDTETGLYYCGSRYYDPVTCRWINGDSLLNQESVLGSNMYAYCLNNPVNMTDTTGNLPFFAITAAVGAVFGAIVGGVKAAKAGKSVLKGALAGAAVGGLAGAGLGAAASAALAGSVVATTTQVAIGAGQLVSTVATGGLGAGAAYIVNNLSQAVNNLVPAAQTATSKMQQVYEKGKAGELAANITKNHAHIDSLTGTANYRIPDMLDRSARILGEVKNYSSTISLTAQLKDFALWSQLNGYQMHLYTNSTSFTGPLQHLIDSGVIQVFPIG